MYINENMKNFDNCGIMSSQSVKRFHWSPEIPVMSPVRWQSVNECEKLLYFGRCNRDFSGVTYQKSETQTVSVNLVWVNSQTPVQQAELRQTPRFLRLPSSANVFLSKSPSFVYFSHQWTIWCQKWQRVAKTGSRMVLNSRAVDYEMLPQILSLAKTGK